LQLKTKKEKSNMKSKEKDNIIFIRLFEDEDLLDQIKNVCIFHNVKTAVVLSGIGQIKHAKLGYFKQKGDYLPESFNKPHELLSLSGNINKQNNKYNLHLHSVLSDENKNAIGGHLIEGKVSVTAEIVLLKTSINIQRKLDDNTGLKALFLE
jgi:predicted DNA-binding protein with PD1-like motif